MSGWPYSTAAWKRLRKAHLARFPFCEGCAAMGRPYVLANTVDHVRPISEGGHPFPDHEGLRSYCPACHSAKTVRGIEAGAVRSNKPRKGCDEHGNPLDAAHPWGKSLKADAQRPPPNPNTQLVAKGSQNGR